MKDNIFFDDSIPEIFWRDFRPSKRRYVIIIFDFLNYESRSVVVSDDRDTRYLIFEAKFQKENKIFDKGQMFRFHVPEQTFKIAWHTSGKNISLDPKIKYDVVIEFSRLSQKRMVIHSKHILQTPLSRKKTDNKHEN